MSYEDLADSEQESMRHLADVILDQLAAGRPTADIVRELQSNDWPLDEASEFVDKLHEQRDAFSQQRENRLAEMKPVRFQPILFSINGIGTGMYGVRNHDPATGTYIKTWCVCFVFVPILSLGAYRVVKSEDGNGWHLIGKVPLSRMAKFWNYGVVLGILALVAFGFWIDHTASPEYLARQKMALANKTLESKDVVKACRLYGELVRGRTQQSSDARKKLNDVAQSSGLANLPPSDVTQVFEQLGSLGGWSDEDQANYQAGAALVRKFALEDPIEAVHLLHAIWSLSVPDAQQLLLELLEVPFQTIPESTLEEVYTLVLDISPQPAIQTAVVEAGVDWITNRAETDPREALAFAEFLSATQETPPETVQSLCRQLLEQAVAANPADVDLAVRLALQLETDGQTDRIKPLLAPHRQEIGNGEGARLFGHILADEGKFDEAYELLNRYLEPRLVSLHDSQEAFGTAITTCQENTLRQLQQGLAPGFDLPRYLTISEEDRQTMVVEYMNKRLRESGSVEQARARLLQHAAVVPVAMDLGIITLRRAQGMVDAKARHAELEKAEKIFLAVQGIAGDDESFRLRVGQVYYWLGKHDEGKREFDQLLESTNRSFGSLLRVASLLREIGSYGEARTCIEEAYEKAPDDASRHAAAYMRSTTSTDAKDGISWLERCDQGQASIRADLQAARGHEAVKAGDKDEAAKHFRQAVVIYDGMNVTSSSLNNSGLICLALHKITKEPKALQDATTRLEKAAALEPNSAILLANAANVLLQVVVRDLAEMDRELAGAVSLDDFDALNYLVRDEAELDQLRSKARNHKGLRSARAYLDTAMVMAPRSPNAYYRALRVDAFLRDEGALRQLANRAKSATFDLESQAEHYLQFYRFEEDSTEQSQTVRKAAEAAEDVARYRRAGNKTALAVSIGKLLQYTVTLHDISDVNADELVQLAEESHAASPTLGTYWSLASALVFRAHQTLSKSFPEYAEAGETARRSLTPFITVVLVLSHQTELGEAARQNPDIQRLASLMKERVERFPSSRGAWSWALLHALDSPAAVQLAEHIKGDEVDQFIRDSDRRLATYSASHACYAYWARLAGGNAQDARAPLQQVIDLGVPVPLYLLGWDKD